MEPNGAARNDTPVVTGQGLKQTANVSRRRPEHIAVTVTFLEMTAPPARLPPLPVHRQVALLRPATSRCISTAI